MISANPVKSELELDQSTEVSFVPMECVHEYGGMDTSLTKPLEDVFNGYTYFKEDDVVVAKITPCFENGKGAIARGLVNGIGFGTTEFHVLRSGEHMDTDFLFYITISSPFRKIGEAYMYGAGGQKRISDKFIKNLRFPFPPKEEQTLIARFLDQKINQIDQLIEQKEKLLKLLAEKRIAIITQAVTKGLNPDAEMKDSGIDWIGKIPKHWKTIKLRYLGRMKSGDGITSIQMTEGEQYPVYGGNGLRGFTSNYTHEGEFILIGRQGALCGNINYAKGKFWASEHAVVVTKSENVDLTWLGELLRTMNLNQYSVSAAQPGLAIDRIQNLEVPLPPFEEQIQISKYLEKLGRDDSIKSSIEKSILQLKEYRQALITAAVTGQIDVRKEVSDA